MTNHVIADGNSFKTELMDNVSLSNKDSGNLCHEPFVEYGYLMTVIGHFWLEGILLLIVGLFGVAGNIMTIVVLRKMETNTTFNRLLMSLGNNYVTNFDKKTQILNLIL